MNNGAKIVANIAILIATIMTNVGIFTLGFGLEVKSWWWVIGLMVGAQSMLGIFKEISK